MPRGYCDGNNKL